MALEEEGRFYTSLEKQRQSKNLYIVSVPPVVCTSSFILGKMNELEGICKFDLVIIDYLGLMNADGPAARKDSWEKLGDITLHLKDVAMQKRVPIITVAHVNRDAMKKKGDKFGFTDTGLSIEISKHVDFFASWRILRPDEFHLTKVGEMNLSLIGARDSDTPDTLLNANMHVMKIRDYVRSGG